MPISCILVGVLRRAAPLLLLGLSCVGPDAPDVEVCRDVITRLCLGPVCGVTSTKLNVNEAGCEATLQARTGCDRTEFAFATPARARVLECRLPLVRESTSRLVKASCENVEESFRICPDLVGFLGGTP